MLLQAPLPWKTIPFIPLPLDGLWPPLLSVGVAGMCRLVHVMYLCWVTILGPNTFDPSKHVSKGTSVQYGSAQGGGCASLER